MYQDGSDFQAGTPITSWKAVVELFGGVLTPFLEQGEVVFGGVRALLDEHFERLSALEQSVLLWLAILREQVRLEQLLVVLGTPRPPAQVLEAVDGLRRRSLIERGQRLGSFTLHSVVLEYVTAHLVAQASEEIEQGRLSLLIQYRLCEAQAKEYVRQTQERLLVVPLLVRLQSAYRGYSNVEERLRFLLDQVRTWNEDAQGYGPANLVVLLRLLRGDLRGLDLSRLALARRVFARRRDARCQSVRSGSPGQRLHRAFRCHHGGHHEQYRAVLGRRGQARGSAGVARGRPDITSGLAGPHGPCAVPRLQSRRTHAGQREPGWQRQAVGRGQWGPALVGLAYPGHPLPGLCSRWTHAGQQWQ